MFTVGVFLPALDPSFLTCLSTFLLPVSSHNNQRYYSSSLITVSITLCTGERSSLEHLLTFPSAAPPLLQPAVLSPELDPSVASCVCRRVCVCVCVRVRGRERYWLMPLPPMHTFLPAQPNPTPLSEHHTVHHDSFSSDLKVSTSQHIFSH